MKTEFLNPKNKVKKWFVIDAANKVLGQVAVEAASILRGKRNPQFSHSHDIGDYVVVINSDKIVLTGRKWQNKKYYHHTGFVGGIVEEKAETLHARKPDELVKLAVRGMLPKGPLGREVLRKLKVYATDKHPHEAQAPQNVQI